jgi:hypothetical protein
MMTEVSVIFKIHLNIKVMLVEEGNGQRKR